MKLQFHTDKSTLEPFDVLDYAASARHATRTKKRKILDHCVSGNGRRRWLIIQEIGCSVSYYMRVKRANGLRDYDDMAK